MTRSIRAGVLSLCLVSLIIYQLPARAASNENDWLSAPKIYADQVGTLKELPLRNKQCISHTEFVTRQADPIHLIMKQAEEHCATHSAYGMQSEIGNLLTLNDSERAGKVVSALGTELRAVPVPNSQNFVFMNLGTYGDYYFSIKDIVNHFKYENQPDGTLALRLNDDVAPTPYISPSGRLIEVNDLNFSSNGLWGVGDSPFNGMTRFNAQTGQSLIFGPAMNYRNGLIPVFVTSISNSGRYAVISENTYRIFRIYDLSTCRDGEPNSCQWRDLSSSIQPNNSIEHLTLSDAQTITVITRQGQEIKRVVLSPSPDQPHGYIAMGDSFASGEGAFSYKSYTDIESPFNKCHLSVRSYPYLLQEFSDHSESVACSGARLKDITQNNFSPQSSGKSSPNFNDEIYENFLVGYRPQIDFVEQNKPRIVTVSIGGNDFGFGSLIAACLKPNTCYNKPQDQVDIAYSVALKQNQLAGAYALVKQAAHPKSKIYIVGYPQLANTQGSCGLNVHFNQGELSFVSQLITTINQTIRRAAQQADVEYIDTSNAFNGHRLCETSGANTAVNGLTAGVCFALRSQSGVGSQLKSSHKFHR